MLKSAAHLAEAAHCRTLAASSTDANIRTVLFRMATLFEKLAARAEKSEPDLGPSK